MDDPTGDQATAALLDYATAATADPDARLLHGRTNVVVAAGPFVFRAARAGHQTTEAALRRSLSIASAAARTAPVLTGPARSRPVEVAGTLVTVWPRLHPTRPSTHVDVTAALALLHATPAPAPNLPPAGLAAVPRWDPAATMSALTGVVPSGDLDRLRRLAGLGADRLREWCGPDVLVHHDAKRPNVVVGADGPHLVDLDGLRSGPALLDLAIVLSAAARGEVTDEQLLTAYPAARSWIREGAGLADSPHAELARTMRAVDQLVWQARTDPAAAAHAAARVTASLARQLA